ncbi:MAG: hypothetical protein BAJATHORv1_90074 [Candidatus Thorarchaeota archaeon]|nr:MAG: hypothetical protein BAJATHORv1_90074 [Candidatus Thorarchaeota archaeon]
MIRSDLALDPILSADMQENGREIDIYEDPEVVRLVALNLELAVKNLMASNSSPECLILTADICTHRLLAMPKKNGDVQIIVFDN